MSGSLSHAARELLGKDPATIAHTIILACGSMSLSNGLRFFEGTAMIAGHIHTAATSFGIGVYEFWSIRLPSPEGFGDITAHSLNCGGCITNRAKLHCTVSARRLALDPSNRRTP